MPELRLHPEGAAVQTDRHEAGLFFDGACWGSGGAGGDRGDGYSGAGQRSGYLEQLCEGRGKDVVVGDTASGG